MRPRAWFWLALGATLVVKLLLAGLLPVLGDEAYFFVWGEHPALGYYEHPPVIGWILGLLLTLGDHPALLRLPSVVLSAAVALGMVALLRERGEEDGAYLAALLYLLTPINVLGVLILTDTPLILFSFLATAALARGVDRDDLRWYGAAGVFLGLAFLSKYLAVLLGIAFLLLWLAGEKGRRRNLGFGTLYAASLPFVLLNLYWNYTHCWTNVAFNLYTRHIGEMPRSTVQSLVIWTVANLWVVTPPLLFLVVRRLGRAVRAWRAPDLRVFGFTFVAPMAMMTGFAVLGAVGGYWCLPFYPGFFLLLPRILERRELVLGARWMALAAVLHLAVVGGLMARPLESWKGSRAYASLVMMTRTQELLDRLEPYLGEYHLAAVGYSPASVLSYKAKQHVFVFGRGSHYGRQDDLLLDMADLDGQGIMILSKHGPPEEYARYFREVRYEEVELYGARFYLLLGQGFEFKEYRVTALDEARRRYYGVMGFLPQEPCFFCEKYFGSGDCRDGVCE